MEKDILKEYWPWMPFDDGIQTPDRKEFTRRLLGMSEFYAAGFFEQADTPLYMRYATALLRSAEHLPVMAWQGTHLFPATPQPIPKDLSGHEEYLFALWDWHAIQPRKRQAILYNYNQPLLRNPELLHQKMATGNPEDRRVLEQVDRFFFDRLTYPGGYTHCTVNYERILREGFAGHRRRIQALLHQPLPDDKKVFYESLLLIIQAAETLQQRLYRAVETSETTDVDRKVKLLTALAHVPMEPARNFYEAMVAANFVFYFEGCDSPGRVDQYLWPFYDHDRKAGLTTEDFAVEIMAEFWDNINHLGAWNVAIGGTKGPDGCSAVNELTYICLEAAKHRRRPNLALRIPKDADDTLWDKTFDVLATGNGLPALYNNEGYVQALKDFGLGLSETDAHEISFGGCTETMIQGCSNVGSLAGTFHLLAVLERTIGRDLAQSGSFEEFLGKYFDALRDDINLLCDEVNLDNEIKARLFPQMVRSLLVDDCIEKGREFFRSGARYNWEVIGLEGFPNVVDSLFTIKKLVYDTSALSGRKLSQILAWNFNGYENLLAQIRALPKYGQGNPEVDILAKLVADFTFKELKNHSAWRGGKFLPACLMFETYAFRGQIVGATPDGRLAREPLGDSMGAYQGRDKFGPTALLNSVTSYQHKNAPGTLVVNIRFGRDMLTQEATRKKVRSLIETYFARGGMQIQVTIVDQTVLQDAMAHPERHEDLIIRIGGYSQYFNDLSQELKLSVLERTIHDG